MKTQLLIEEVTPSEAGIITEMSQDTKNMYLTGVFMQAGIKNRNGRVYPINEISNAVEIANKQIKECNGIMGELDHPQNLTVNLDRVSHIITELRMDGNNAIGRAKLIDTPMGRIARELFANNIRVGMSSRGTGSVNEGQVSDFNFLTIDLVSMPSAPGALPNAVYESLEMAKNGAKILTLAEQVREDAAAQKFLKEEIMKWLKTQVFVKK